MTTLTVNGRPVKVTADPDKPLLWVLREDLSSTGTKFGCGMALCGACTVHLDGSPGALVRDAASQRSKAGGSRPSRASRAGGQLHPVQEAWIEQDVPQCGYCQSGQVMSAAALLARAQEPDRRRHRRGHERQHLPLRDLPAHPRRDQAGGRRAWPAKGA